jgi:hypothetical protein
MRLGPSRLVVALVALAVLVAAPVLAGCDPPSNGANDQVALVDALPPWYESGFWTASISDVPGAVMNYASAACPTEETCIAWGEPPNFKSVFNVSTDGGATWRQVGTSNVNPEVGNIACWDTLHCIIGGSPPELTNDGGRRWAVVADDARASAVDAVCPSPGHCLLTNYQSGQLTGPPSRPVPVLVTRDGGAKWAPADLPKGQWSVVNATCPTATDCFATGGDSSGRADTGGILISKDSGLRWYALTPPEGVAEVSAIACENPRHCVIAAAVRTAAGETTLRWYSSTDGGTTWHETKGLSALDGSPGIARLACSRTSCVSLVGLRGGPWESLVSEDGGFTWVPDNLAPYLAGKGAGISLAPLSCNPTGRCVLAAEGPDGGFVLFSSDGGHVWARGNAAMSVK